MNPNINANNLAKLFASTSAGRFNQDISFLLVGKKGRGKSRAALSLCCMSAHEVAEIVGGEWRDYFSIEHVAVIDPEMAADLIVKTDRYGVYDYDDIALAWNARNYATEENKDKNDLFQINRVDNTVQIFSAPHQFLLDKVPRSLVSHYGEMDTFKRGFTYGFSMMKLFEPITLFREGKQINPYLFVDRHKFIQYIIPPPPKRMVEEYEKLRYKITQKIKILKRDKIRNRGEVGGGSPSPNQKKVIAERKFHQAFDFVHLQGYTVRDACLKAGISESTYRKYVWKDPKPKDTTPISQQH